MKLFLSLFLSMSILTAGALSAASHKECSCNKCTYTKASRCGCTPPPPPKK